MRAQLDECRTNKKEMEVCKEIGARLQEIIKIINPKDLKIRITAKQAII
jgi:hypothetical protein